MLLLKEISHFKVLEENKRRKLSRLLQCLEETRSKKLSRTSNCSRTELVDDEIKLIQIKDSRASSHL